jgi:hypothetical protein
VKKKRSEGFIVNYISLDKKLISLIFLEEQRRIIFKIKKKEGLYLK